VLRDLRAFARVVASLGRDPTSRRAFWGALLDCVLHNPRALKVAVSFAALYLHFGPFSRSLVARLDRKIACATIAAEPPPRAIAAVPLPD
jgi:hypothetical protein